MGEPLINRDDFLADLLNGLLLRPVYRVPTAEQSMTARTDPPENVSSSREAAELRAIRNEIQTTLQQVVDDVSRMTRETEQSLEKRITLLEQRMSPSTTLEKGSQGRPHGGPEVSFPEHAVSLPRLTTVPHSGSHVSTGRQPRFTALVDLLDKVLDETKSTRGFSKLPADARFDLFWGRLLELQHESDPATTYRLNIGKQPIRDLVKELLVEDSLKERVFDRILPRFKHQTHIKISSPATMHLTADQASEDLLELIAHTVQEDDAFSFDVVESESADPSTETRSEK